MDGFASMVQQELYRESAVSPPLSADEARNDIERVAITAAESLLNDDLRPATKLKLLVRLAALVERSATDLGLVEPAAPVAPKELAAECGPARPLGTVWG